MEPVRADYLSLLGESRLVQPLQHISIGNEIKKFLTSPRSYQFSSSLFNELELGFRSWLSPLLPNLDEFRYFYLAPGILEALNLEGLLCSDSFYFLRGDFNYLEQANQSRALETKDLTSLAPGARVYLSVPSAIDGQMRPQVFDGLSPLIHQYWDLAYACTVSPSKAVTIPAGVTRLVCSLSKIIGEPALRQGFILSREPIPVLDFLVSKHYVSLLLAPLYIELFRKFPQSFLYQRLSSYQERACRELGIDPSDCVLIGHTDREEFNYWRRGSINRIYLGKYMLDNFPEVRQEFQIP